MPTRDELTGLLRKLSETLDTLTDETARMFTIGIILQVKQAIKDLDNETTQETLET